jgi:hypothetical protein
VYNDQHDLARTAGSFNQQLVIKVVFLRQL